MLSVNSAICPHHLLACCVAVQPMSEDPSSDAGSDDGGYDGLMDDKEEKELMVECGQRQVRRSKQTAQDVVPVGRNCRCMCWID